VLVVVEGGVEAVVGGGVVERVRQMLRVANQGGAGFERGVEPLVGVDGEGVGEVGDLRPGSASGRVAAGTP